ncbi:Phytochrome A [Sesamum angolense]|uniref:Phytochrome A n=1 Tax=Sesamum angolense TaxID=2727404 RepID=A0AAE1W3F0_9LAMI|nr:Phytochrome A [Sesamum angolense]
MFHSSGYNHPEKREDKFTRIEGEYRAIVQNLNQLIPSIFGANKFGWCSEWNIAMTKLSRWNREDVISKMLIGEVFGTHAACFHLKSDEAFLNLGVVLNNAVTGQDSEKIPFVFFLRSGKYVESLLSVSKKFDGEGVVKGVFASCSWQVMSSNKHFTSKDCQSKLL